jgi:hypothetical protein
VSLDLVKNKSSFTSKIADEMTASLTADLRERASTAEWPTHIINTLEVTSDGPKVNITYPDDFKSDIADLEYGGIYTLRNPVLRPFAAEAAAELAALVKGRIAEDFHKNGGLW